MSVFVRLLVLGLVLVVQLQLAIESKIVMSNVEIFVV